VAYEALQALSGVVCRPSDGTFYIFPSFRGFLNEIERWKDDVAFARALLDEVGVAVVPGSAFGAPGHIRLSFALDTDSLREALARIRRFVEDHLRRG
jgi:aspartate aminotransferase